MSTRDHSPDPERRFDWPVCREAEGFILSALDRFLARHSFATNLARRMSEETGTLLLDWTDSLTLAGTNEKTLRGLGFVPDPFAPGQQAWHHPEALLPRVLLGDAEALCLKPESLVDFMSAHDLSGPIEGAPLTGYRRTLVSEENGARLYAVERRGSRTFVPAAAEPGRTEALLRAHELWQTRRRHFASDDAGYAHSLALLDDIIALTGRDLACHVVFTGERSYWQRRNRAARVQKARQMTHRLETVFPEVAPRDTERENREVRLLL